MRNLAEILRGRIGKMKHEGETKVPSGFVWQPKPNGEESSDPETLYNDESRLFFAAQDGRSLRIIPQGNRAHVLVTYGYYSQVKHLWDPANATVKQRFKTLLFSGGILEVYPKCPDVRLNKEGTQLSFPDGTVTYVPQVK